MNIGTPPTYAPVVQEKDRLADKGWISWFSAIARVLSGDWYRGTAIIKGVQKPVTARVNTSPLHADLYCVWETAMSGGEMRVNELRFDFGLITLINYAPAPVEGDPDVETIYKAIINEDGYIEIPAISTVNKLVLTGSLAVKGKEI